MDQPIALQVQMPQIDMGGALEKAARINQLQSANALNQFNLKEQGALANARETYRANPNDIGALNGFPELQQGAVKAQAGVDEAKNERLARDAQYVKGFSSDPNAFTAAWQDRLGAAHQRGDIPPLMYSQLSQQPPNVDMLNNIIQRGAKIPSRLDEAHAGYYEEVARARGAIAGAVQQNADTKRLKIYGDVLQQLGPTPPTREIWDQQIRTPGSLLNIALGGRQIPYEQAPQAWTEIKSRVAAGPDDQELASRGISEETINQLRRSKAMEQSLGKPKVGYFWDVDKATGRPVQTLVAEKEDPKQAVRDRSAPIFMKNLDMASAVLKNSNAIGSGIAEIPGVGGMLNPSVKEALELSGHAIAQLTAIVDGNRHANAQDVRFLQFFKPNWYDTGEIKQFKLDQAKQFFNAYLSQKAAGRSDQYLSERFHSAVEKAYETLQQKKGMSARPQEPDPRVIRPGATGNDDPRGLSDQELLKRLQQ